MVLLLQAIWKWLRNDGHSWAHSLPLIIDARFPTKEIKLLRICFTLFSMQGLLCPMIEIILTLYEVGYRVRFSSICKLPNIKTMGFYWKSLLPIGTKSLQTKVILPTFLLTGVWSVNAKFVAWVLATPEITVNIEFRTDILLSQREQICKVGGQPGLNG